MEKDLVHYESFGMILSSIKKHYLLAMLAITRKHHTQATLLLKYILEMSALLFYTALENKQTPEELMENFHNKDGSLNEKKMKDVYDSIKENFSEEAGRFKKVRDILNKNYAHANFTETLQYTTIQKTKINTTFFDKKSSQPEKDFTLLSGIGLMILDILLKLNQEKQIFTYGIDLLLFQKELEKTHKQHKTLLDKTYLPKTKRSSDQVGG